MPNDGKCLYVFGNGQKCNYTRCKECPVYDEFKELLEDLRMEQQEQM